MSIYRVHVTQIDGDDSITVEVEAGHPADAQVSALHLVFDSCGWRRITAHVPEEVQ